MLNVYRIENWEERWVMARAEPFADGTHPWDYKTTLLLNTTHESPWMLSNRLMFVLLLSKISCWFQRLSLHLILCVGHIQIERSFTFAKLLRKVTQ